MNIRGGVLCLGNGDETRYEIDETSDAIAFDAAVHMQMKIDMSSGM